MNHVPEHFARHVIEMCAERGRAWLHQLPTLLADCERRWSLTILPPFPNLTYNYVAPAVRADGLEVVVKIGVPCHPDILTELEALRVYGGHGMVQSLDADREQLIMLLERLRPGTPLSSVADDEQATAIAAQVMRAFWRPPPPQHNFRTLAEWAEGLTKLRAYFGASTRSFPIPIVETAEALFAELIGSMTEAVLLHGDLWHDNILGAEREAWLAIDPQGVVGEPAFDAAALLSSPLPQLLAEPQAGRILARRAAQLAEALGFERERLIAWGVAYAVLLAWWNVEDRGYGWEEPIVCAELLASML